MLYSFSKKGPLFRRVELSRVLKVHEYISLLAKQARYKDVKIQSDGFYIEVNSLFEQCYICKGKFSDCSCLPGKVV